MKERLIAKLFNLHRKLKSISSYNHENGNTLFKYSIEFETLLSSLLRVNHHEFNAIANYYSQETQRYCELGCELSDEKNREKAFSTGKSELDLYVRECLKILTQHRPETIQT